HAPARRPPSPGPWRGLPGRLARLARLRGFDDVGSPMRSLPLLRPGQVSVIDLSDTDSPALSNLVIADVLRGVQETQEKLYGAYERAAREGRTAPPPARVLIVIEEAHEFLSAERADQIPILIQQVARIAKRR